jgi:SNF2 family DNA or RNA helicase
MDIINKLPPDEKIVISYEYTGSGDEICKVLEKNKIKYTRLYSETKDKTDAINKFKKDPKYRVIVLNSKSGGVSINLQNSHRMIIYELPTSPIIYQQLIPRIYRTGQTEKTFIYILEIKDSIDIKVKTFLLLGKNYFNSIIEGKDEV